MALYKLDPNFLYANVKVGSKKDVSGKSVMKDGMVIEWYDARDWRNNEVVFSDNMQITTALIKLKRDWRTNLINGVKSVSKTGKERARANYFELSELEIALGIPSLEANLRGKSIVPVLDGTGLSSALLKDSTKKDAWYAFDLNATTSGSHDIGSGETFTTWSAAYADLGDLTANLTFRGVSATTETSSPVITEDLKGFTFLNNSDTPHNGDVTAGHLVSWNAAGVLFNLQQEDTVGGGILEIKDLRMKRLVDGGSSFHGLIQLAAIGTEHLVKLNDLFLDGNGKIGSGIYSADSTPIIEAFNLKIWTEGGASSQGLYFETAINAKSKFENITVFSTTNNFRLVNLVLALVNCLSLDSVTTDFSQHGNAIGRSCVSTDATANSFGTNVNNTDSVTATDEVRSLDDTEPDFLKSKSEGKSEDEGHPAMILENVLGIRGNARPH